MPRVRFRVRTLMIVIGAVALAMGAGQMYDRSRRCREKADSYRKIREAYSTPSYCSRFAAFLQSLPEDERRRRLDELSKRYAEENKPRDEEFRRLEMAFRRAAWRPWEAEPVD